MPGGPFRENFAIERYRKGGSTYYFTQGLGAATASALALTQDRLYGCPFFVPVTQKYDYIAINVTTYSNAANVRLGVYADLGTVAPGRLIQDAGAVAIGSTGVKSIDLTATPIILVGGQLYWLALIISAIDTIRATTVGTNLTCFFGLDSTLGTAWYTFCYIARAYGALPDPFGAGITLASGSMPAVFLRKV